MTNGLPTFKKSEWKITELLSLITPPLLKPTYPHYDGVDRKVRFIEGEVKQCTDTGKYETTTETTENTGSQKLMLHTSGLFDDLDTLLKPYEEIESLYQMSADESKCPLGLLDDVNSDSLLLALQPESPPDLKESSMGNPFFEEFMDLDQLFPELAGVDTLNVGFTVEQGLPVVQSDICHSDVVTWKTGITGEDSEADSPYSEIIDVESTDTDSEFDVLSPSVSASDVTQSLESSEVVMVTDDDRVSEETATNLEYEQCTSSDQPVAEEVTVITVVASSDPLTLLTQELTDPSTPSEGSKLSPSNLTVDHDQLFSISELLGLSDMDMSSWVGDHSEKEDDASVNPVKDKPQPKRKPVSSSESSINPAKKAKHDSTNVNSAQEELDRRTIRRLKNNIASKHARANRKHKELELFQKEEELEKDNAQLRKQLKELELLTSSLRKVLVEKLSSGATCAL